jgi:hypothetical protein
MRLALLGLTVDDILNKVVTNALRSAFLRDGNFLEASRATAHGQALRNKYSSERLVGDARGFFVAKNFTQALFADNTAKLSRPSLKTRFPVCRRCASWLITMALFVFGVAGSIFNAFAVAVVPNNWFVRSAVSAVILFITSACESQPILRRLTASFASGMAFLIALVACPTSVTFSAISVPQRSVRFVASANAIRAAIRCALLTMKANLTSFSALSVDVTLVVVAIGGAALADPLVVHLLFEWKAARHARFWLASFTVASFRASAFWAWHITLVSTPARLASIVAFGIFFVTAATFAAARALLIALRTEETILATAFAQPVFLDALIILTSCRACVFTLVTIPFGIVTFETIAVFFLAAWDSLEIEPSTRLFAIRWARLVAAAAVEINVALIWACACW